MQFSLKHPNTWLFIYKYWHISPFLMSRAAGQRWVHVSQRSASSDSAFWVFTYFDVYGLCLISIMQRLLLRVIVS